MNKLKKNIGIEISKSVPDLEISNICVEPKIYKNYYDINNTITTSQSTNPNDEDNVGYNKESVFEALGRNAPTLIVSNDGSGIIYVIASHRGGQHFTRERPIYPGENKTYYNIYELRLRSPTAGNAYRVTEYPICCAVGSGTTVRGSATRATLNIATNGNNTIVAAPATVGQRIRIVNIFLICSSAVTVTFNSDGNAISGPMTFAANSGMGFNGDFNPLECNINEAFIINLSGNVQVSGFVLYYIE